MNNPNENEKRDPGRPTGMKRFSQSFFLILFPILIPKLFYIGSNKPINTGQFGSKQRHIDLNILNNIQNVSLNENASSVNISDSISQSNTIESNADMNSSTTSYNNLRETMHPFNSISNTINSNSSDSKY